MIFKSHKIMYLMKKTKNLLQWISSDLVSIFWKMRKKMKKCAFLPKTRVKNFSLENQFWSLMNHGKFLMILTIFAPMHMLPQISKKNIKFHDFLNFKTWFSKHKFVWMNAFRQYVTWLALSVILWRWSQKSDQNTQKSTFCSENGYKKCGLQNHYINMI